VTKDAASLLRDCVANPEDAGGHGQIAGGAFSVSPPNERKFRQAEKQLETKLLRRLALRMPQRYGHLYK
jgi:hypothetical protein